MSRFAELGSESDCVRKGFIILLPYRMPFEVSFCDDTFHVIGQYVLGNTHHVKSMDHPYEQIFLFGIGEEFNVHLSAVMTYHCETGDFILVTVWICDPCKTPVHLVSFARSCPVTTASVSLRIDLLSFRRNQILVSCDISLYCGQTTCISHFVQSVEANN